jgi:hypothetical protein
MNKQQLMQFGEFIQKFAFNKSAQGFRFQPWMGALAGGALGAAGGKAVENAQYGNNSGFGGMVAGGLGGAMAGYGATAHPGRIGQLMHTVGTSNLGRWGGTLAGGAAGMYAGNEAYNRLGLENTGLAGKFLALGGGALVGGAGGSLAMDALGRAGVRNMRNSLQGHYGGDIAEALQQRFAGNARVPGTMRELAEMDPNGLVAGQLANNAFHEMDAGVLSQHVNDLAGPNRENLIHGMAGAIEHERGLPGIANFAAQHGFNVPADNPVSRFLHNQLGPNWQQDYLKPALMLGGGYMAANAAADLYNRFQGNDDRRKTKQVIVV